MRFWKKSLMARLVSYYILLSLVAVSFAAFIGNQLARNALESAIFDKLEVAATLKEEELNRWVEDRQRDVVLLSRLPEFQAQTKLLVGQEETTTEYQQAYDLLLDYLDNTIDIKPAIQEFFILSDVGGEVVLSTDQSHEGEYRVTDRYFTQGRLDTFVQNVYLSPVTGKPAITVSTPLFDESGLLLGVLAAHLDLESIDKIFAERTGLGETGETYLVDKFNVFVSEVRFGTEKYPRGVHTDGIDAALQGKSGSGLYLNYREEPVIGVFKWLEEHELALIAEIQQEAALAPARQLAQTILFSGLGVAGLLAVGAYFMSRQIARPILAITDIASKVAAGEPAGEAPVLTEDEIGILAITFNQMTRQLQELIGSLEKRVADRTRALQTSTEVSRRLSTILDQDRLVREVVEQLQVSFGYYHAHIYLFDDTRQNLLMVGGTGQAGRTMLERGHKIKSGQGLVGRAAEVNQVVLISDVSQDPDWLPNPLLPETKAELAIPIAVGPDVLGVLDVQHNVAEGLGQEDADLIQAIASQVAIAVQNARAYTRTQQRAERDARIVAINQRIQSATTVDDVLKIAISELGQALSTKRADVEVKVGSLVDGGQQVG